MFYLLLHGVDIPQERKGNKLDDVATEEHRGQYREIV